MAMSTRSGSQARRAPRPGDGPARDPKSRTGHRRSMVEPLERRELLTVAPYDLFEREVATSTPTSQVDARTANSVAADHDGDFVVAYVRNEILVNPFTNQTIADTNIYVRYFTDEMQRITLPGRAVGGTFSLVVGERVQQTLRIKGHAEAPFGGIGGTGTVLPPVRPVVGVNPPEPEPVGGSFVLGYDVDGDGFLSDDEQVTVPYGSGPALQSALRSLGGPLATAQVQQIWEGEFRISYPAQAAQNGQTRIISVVDDSGLVGGFYPKAVLSSDWIPRRLFDPLFTNSGIRLFNSSDPARVVEVTSQLIQLSFANSPITVVDSQTGTVLSGVSVKVNGRYRQATDTYEFDITFVDRWGKQDIPTIVIDSVRDVAGNPLGSSRDNLADIRVETLKEPSAEMRVNDEESFDPITGQFLGTQQGSPSVAMDADGDFVVVWSSLVPERVLPGSVQDVYARRFNSAGQPLGGQFRVNEATRNRQYNPSVAMDDAGNFVVVWLDEGQENSFFNKVIARRFDLDGNALGSSILVSPEVAEDDIEPDVGMSPDGHFAVVWSDNVGAHNIRAKVYRPDGTLLHDRSLTNPQIPFIDSVPFGTNPTGDFNRQPVVAMDSGNRIYVSWTTSIDQDPGNPEGDNSLGNNPRSFGIRSVWLDQDGNEILSRFRVNSAHLNEDSNPEVGLDQFSPTIAVDADGDLIVGWEGFGLDRDGSIVFGTSVPPGVITPGNSLSAQAAGLLGPDIDSRVRSNLLATIRQNTIGEQQLLTFLQGQSAPTGTFNIVFGNYTSGNLAYQLGQIQTLRIITDGELTMGLDGTIDLFWGLDQSGAPLQGTIRLTLPDPMDPMAPSQAQQLQDQLLQLLPNLGSRIVVPGLPFATPGVQVIVQVTGTDLNGDGIEDYVAVVTFIGTAQLIEWPEIRLVPGVQPDGTPLATASTQVEGPLTVYIRDELEGTLVRGHVAVVPVVHTLPNGNQSFFRDLNGDGFVDFQVRVNWLDSVIGLDFPLVELVAGFDTTDGQRLGRMEEQIVRIFPDTQNITGKYALRFQLNPPNGVVQTFSPFEFTTPEDLIEQIKIVLNTVTQGNVLVTLTPNSGQDLNSDGIPDLEFKIVYGGPQNRNRNVGNLEVLPATDQDGIPLPDALNAFTQTREVVRGSSRASVNVRFESIEEIKGEVLTAAIKARRQLAENQFGIGRGEANGVWYTIFDADATLAPPADRPGVLIDEGANTRVGGVNSQYVLAWSIESALPAVQAVATDPLRQAFLMSRTQLTGTFGVTVAGSGRRIDLDIPFPAQFNNPRPWREELIENIEVALESTGLFGTRNTDDNIPFSVWVRVIPAGEIAARVGTPYEITYSNAAGPVSRVGRTYSPQEFFDVVAVEITFIETFHDRGDVFFTLRTVESLGLEFVALSNGGGGGGNDPNQNDPQYDEIDGVMAFMREQISEPGPEQKRLSVAMEPDGDFVLAWVDGGARFGADSLTVDSLTPLLNFEGRPSPFVNSPLSIVRHTPPNIVYRRYNESTDTTGPKVTDFSLPSGARLQRVRDNGSIDVPTNLLIVSFNEDMSTTGIHSVTNTANWEVIRDGIRVPNAVVRVDYGMNMAADLGLGPRTNKYEAVLYFDGNGPFAGTPPLPNGSYQIVATNRLRDVAGNPLNYSGLQVNGASQTRSFGVSVVGGNERRVNADPLGTQTTAGRFESPQAVASDADGDYVAVWAALPGDAQGRVGIYASLYRGRNRGQQSEKFREIQVTADPTAMYAAVAKDGDGDFVVTWMQFNPTGVRGWDVYARRYDALGNPLGAAFRVNTETEHAQGFASVAMDLDGDFVVAWQSLGQEDDRFTYGIFAQRYNNLGQPVGGLNETQQIQIDGRPQGGTFRLNFEGEVTTPITFSRNPSETADNIAEALEALDAIDDVTVTPLGVGRFNVVFEGAFGQQELGLLVPVFVDLVPSSVMQVTRIQQGRSGEFRVNVTQEGDQTFPSVAMDADGDFVISWTGSGQNGDAIFETNIYARRFARNEVAFPSRARTSVTLEDVLLMEGAAVQPLIVTVDNPNNHLAQLGTASEFSGVARLDIDGSVCSGSLMLDGRHILTAAHCVTDANGVITVQNATATFESSAVTVGAVTIPITRVFVHPGWTGNVVVGNDVAIVELAAEAPQEITRYDIYRNTDEASQRITKVGYGLNGTGQTGGVAFDGLKRWGQNVYDVPGENLNGNVFRQGSVTPGSQMMYDFDNGFLANDAFGVLFNRIDVGLGQGEVLVAPGDSGGPAFIGNLVAGISSYLLTVPAADLLPGPNGSFGDIASDARVSTYASWIDGILSGDSQGGSVSGEFLVNTTTAADQAQSTVAIDMDGDFVIAWSSYGNDGGGNGYGPGVGGTWGVFAQRFDKNAARVGTEFRVNTTLDRDQQAPKVAMDADGDFVIVWESLQERDPGGVVPANFGIYGKRFVRNALLGTSAIYGPNGEIGGEIGWNVTKEGDQRFPSVSMSNEGDIVVLWSGQGPNDTDGVFHATLRAVFDVAGPVVTDVLAPLQAGGFQRVTQDSAIKVLPAGQTNQLLVIFGEEVNSAGVGGFNSVINPNNWQLLVSGRFLPGAIASVEFGLNLMASKGGQPTDKFEVLLTLDGDPTTPGIQPLPRDQYTLVALDRIEDLEENALDGNRDGLAGGNFRLDFSVAREASTGGGGGGGSPAGPPPNPPGDPTEDPNKAVGTDEQRVNTDTFGPDQVQPAVAMNDAGDYVAVWVSDWPIAVGGGFVTEQRIVGRMFNNLGRPIQLLEFGIASSRSSTTSNVRQINPDVAMDKLGGFVVVWEEIAPNNLTDSHGIWGRVYDFTGQPLSDRFLVNQFTANAQGSPSVAVDSAGAFVVTWTSFGQDGDLDGIFARRFNAFGEPLGNEFQVNTTTRERQERPDVAMDEQGDFVIVWNSYGQDGSSWGVYGQRYSAAGVRLGGEFRVNDTTQNQQRYPKVAMDADGDFAVTWQSFGGVNVGYDIYAKRYNAAGTPLGGEFRVNQVTAAYQQFPDVAMSNEGELYFTWTSANQDGDRNGIMARLYGNGFESLGEFRVNKTVQGDQFGSAIAADADGDLVVVWVGPGQNPPGRDIYSRYMLINEPVDSTIDLSSGSSGTVGTVGGGTSGGGGGGGGGGQTGSWHNLALAEDVNNDGTVNPLDVLLIINRINSGQQGTLGDPPPAGTVGHHFVDVNNDGRLTSLDALWVINYINSNNRGLRRANVNAGSLESAAPALAAPLTVPALLEVDDGDEQLDELAWQHVRASQGATVDKIFTANDTDDKVARRAAIAAAASALSVDQLPAEVWDVVAELELL